MRIELWDSFNNVLISKHNSLEKAILKQRKHLREVKKANGQNSYLIYEFKYSSGDKIDGEVVFDAKSNIDKY